MRKAVESKCELVRTVAAEVTLTMDEEHVHTLLDILGCVGGDPTTSYRKHSDALYTAIVDVLPIDVYDRINDSPPRVWGTLTAA